MSFQASSHSGSKVRAKLTVITALVLLAHGGLLYGTPMVLVTHSPHDMAAFSTRVVSPPTPLPPRVPSAMALPAVPRPPIHKTQQIPAGLPAMPAEALPTQEKAIEEDDTGAERSAEPQPMELDELLATTPQLLGASGPPANRSPHAVTKMVAAAETFTSGPSLGATGGGANRAAPTKSASSYSVAPSAHLKYVILGQVRGFDAQLKGELQWQHDGKTYEAKLTVSHFLLGSRVQTSRGELGVQGLEPVRFGDKYRSERAAHY